MHALLLLSLMITGPLALTGCRPTPVDEQQAASVPAQPEEDTAMPRQAEYHKITAQEAKAWLDKDPTVKLIDVRTEEEFREKRIANSILIPDYEIEQRAPKMLPDKEETILLYCRSGRRSREAATKLVGMGYTQVYDFGGIIDWPYATISGK